MDWMNRMNLLLGICLLAGCSLETRTRMDDFWRTVDPIGHGRSHREHYYPSERRTGLKMPGASDGVR